MFYVLLFYYHTYLYIALKKTKKWHSSIKINYLDINKIDTHTHTSNFLGKFLGDKKKVLPSF